MVHYVWLSRKKLLGTSKDKINKYIINKAEQALEQDMAELLELSLSEWEFKKNNDYAKCSDG